MQYTWNLDFLRLQSNVHHPCLSSLKLKPVTPRPRVERPAMIQTLESKFLSEGRTVCNVELKGQTLRQALTVRPRKGVGQYSTGVDSFSLPPPYEYFRVLNSWFLDCRYQYSSSPSQVPRKLQKRNWQKVTKRTYTI